MLRLGFRIPFDPSALFLAPIRNLSRVKSPVHLPHEIRVDIVRSHYVGPRLFEQRRKLRFERGQSIEVNAEPAPRQEYVRLRQFRIDQRVTVE
ncbi:hypothetical protein D3C74_443540 [compost metagenome]